MPGWLFAAQKIIIAVGGRPRLPTTVPGASLSVLSLQDAYMLSDRLG